MKLYDSFEACCEALGINSLTVLPDVTSFPEELREVLLSDAKLIIVVKAHQGDWKPDWNNSSERKWFPWFDMEVDDNNPSGFRFDGSVYVLTYSLVGSRLCLPSEELSDHVGKTFEDLYRAKMVIK